ncbi:MAG TPA: adenosine deaminase [Candidatus Angelobacter sp.]|nr:adenosine deaminase [Candidatus Angelobacter sp.]
MPTPDRFDAIPKVELHCHVEGTVRPATVVELARRHGRSLPTEDPTELYRYDSLDSFLEVFWLVQSLIGDREDWARVAYESIVDAVPHGLRHREMFFTPARHLAAGQSLADVVAGLTEGVEAAERETATRCDLVCDIDRSFGADAARELASQLATLRRSGRAERVIGMGMDSTERGVDLGSFAPAYRVARDAGLRLTGHAGEDGGPDNIASALDLGAERIDHGIAIVEDDQLVRRAVEQRIPLNVCPTSNVVIANRYAALADHPLRVMREAGLLVTINTDDPAMISLDLGTEYRAVAEALGYSFEEMCALSIEGIEATWLDESDRRALRASFHAEIAAIPAA